MKTTIPSLSKATAAKTIQRIASSHEEQEELSGELLNLSPERFTDRASAATQVLNRFLERDDKTNYLRHWGINE